MPPEAALPTAVCSRCRAQPALVPHPFCAACLLAKAGSRTGNRTVGTPVLPDRPAGTVVGDYMILELLGAGGFAEVYSARPVGSVPREGEGASPLTALKIIKRGMDSREILARFQAE